MKALIQEFKEFIAKGNAMTMAVGLIIGSAFTAIVNSLVDNIISPFLGILLGGMDFSGLALTIGSASIEFGLFINAVITFFLTAIVLFLLVKGINKLTPKKKEEKPAIPEPEPTPEDVLLLQEIRDLLKNSR